MNDKVKAILGVANAMLETVREAGDHGAPAGPMYAACMSCGISLEVFNNIMSALVIAGKVTKRGHVYYPVR